MMIVAAFLLKKADNWLAIGEGLDARRVRNVATDPEGMRRCTSQTGLDTDAADRVLIEATR
jgi:hypothetical protein